MKKISIGSDHAGYDYKNEIIKFLIDLGYEVKDYGTNNNDSVDYPDYVHPTTKAVVNNEVNYGIVICGSGNGVAMTANKYSTIRCGLAWDVEIAELIRLHNNANMIAVPARYTSIEKAKEIVKTFLETDFEGGRHQNRINKISCF